MNHHTTSTLNVAVIQMVSGCHPADNLECAEKLIRQAANQGATWIVLPEYWSLMGQDDHAKVREAETFNNGLLQSAIAALAKQLSVVIFAGSMPILSANAGKVHNSLITYGKDGRILGRYDKKHLFAYRGLGECYREADTLCAGAAPETLTIDGWQIGRGICFDLRFSNFFVDQAPFDVLVLPAAFTYTTGQDHWEVLLRARAIELQCYVLAAAQGGQHDNGRHTFGHSMIIDPWGKVLASHATGEGIINATISLERIKSVRQSLPAMPSHCDK